MPPLRVGRLLAADVHAALAIALGIPVIVGEAVYGFRGSGSVVLLTAAYFGLQLVLAIAVGGGVRGLRGLIRFLLGVAFVAILSLVEPRTSPTLAVLYIPIITLAAATSLPAGVTVGVAAAVATRISLAIQFGPTVALDQSILPVVVMAFLVVGTRQVVSSLERSLERLQHVARRDRRKARRLRAIEGLGRLLAQDGPSAAALETIMDVLVEAFGYRYPSVYLWNGRALVLGAQRGYANPILEFDLELGIIGRVARTREPVFAPDVTEEPDYAEADSAVVSEISVPLLADGELLGVLNVESTAAEALDRDDYASMLTIADRLAASIALGRERQKLAERAALLGRLADAFANLGAILDPTPLQSVVAAATTTVVPCQIGLLTLVDAVGAYRIVAAEGVDAIVGMQIEPGEGATGRAIAERVAVLDDEFDRDKYPRAARRAIDDPTVAVMAIPMVRDDRVIGALTFIRRQPATGFTEQEREVGALLAAQVALAVTNATLHADAREAAIRDPLTRLHNRRLLDDALARIGAQRARQAPDERRPLAAIMFDLDRFGELNNQHGHAAGDAVLRTFAGLLAGRFRTSDLVARYGGEEFLVVLDGASREDAVRTAEEIRLAFRDLAVPISGGASLRATVSAGCAALNPSSAAVDPMIAIADVGLAMAKSAGRDQVVAA